MLTYHKNGTTYQLISPRSCSRTIIPGQSQPQAFGLPNFKADPVMMEGFSGDTELGASCNVRLISYTPHNLTHVETPAHILKGAKSLMDIPHEIFQSPGIVLDLTSVDFTNNYILPEHLDELQNYSEFEFIAIKTTSSLDNENQDFTGTDPLSLHPSTTKYITEQYPQVRLLILDLPSADKEADGGKLLAHRNFFDFDKNPKGLDKAIIELAYFGDHPAGYSYLFCTPSIIDTDAISTDLILYVMKPLP